MPARQKDVKVRILSEYYDAGSKAAERATRRLASLQMAAAQQDIAREQAKAGAIIAANASQAASMETMGRRTLAVSAAIAIGLGLTAKAAMDWESAWAGVRKVVSGSDADLGVLEGQLRGLAKVLPATHEEIALVAETAGQLGVAREDIAAFTRTAINMGETTNLAADEAATSMAQLGNIMGIGASKADRMGSAIVALGNDGASTERDIVSMALRIAGAGRTVGMTTDQVLAISSALSSVGLEAEAGGSAISRVMLQIDRDVDAGSESLATYAQVAGMSADEFKQKWGTDAAGALTAFISGLGKVQASGGSTTKILDTLGFTEIRVSDSLRRAALSGDLLTDALKTGSAAWEDNLALTAEANKRYQTTEARLQIARNQINDAAIDIGGNLLPMMADAADHAASLAAGFGTLPEPVQEWVTKLGLAAVGVTAVVGVASLAIPKLQALSETITSLRGGTSLLGRALGGTASTIAGPWGLAIAGAVALMGFWMSAQGDAKRETDAMVDTLDQHTAAITENTRQLVYNNLESNGTISRAKELGISLRDLVDAALDPTSDAADRLGARLAELDSMTIGDFGDDQAAFNHHETVVNDFVDVLGRLGTQGDLVSASQDRVRDQVAAGIAPVEEATDAQVGLAGAMGETNVVMEDGRVLVEDAAAAVENLTKALDELNSPTLDAREAERQFQDAVDGVAEAVSQQVDELARQYEASGMSTEAAHARAEAEVSVADKLDRGTEAGRRNEGALDAVAEAAMRRANAILEQTGSEDAFRTSLEASRTSLFEQAKQFFATDTEAMAYVDTVLSVPPSVVTQAEMRTEQAEADLEAMIARNQGKRIRLTAELSTSGNPIYVSANGTKMQAEGGILEFYAAGGIRRGLTPMAPRAQMVPANTWRVVGDRPVGDESYIPIDGSADSRAIWAQTGQRLGVSASPEVNVTVPAPSIVGARIEGTVDLGNGLTGYLRAVVQDELADAGSRATYRGRS